AAFAPDGSSLCTINHTGIVTLWDPQTYSPRMVLPTSGKSLHCVQYCHDSRVIAAAGADGIIRRWEIKTGRPLPDLRSGHPVETLAFSRDDTTLASAGFNTVIRLWDLANSKQRLILPGHSTEPVWSLVFSPDGKRLASCGHDSTIKLWQPDLFY